MALGALSVGVGFVLYLLNWAGFAGNIEESMGFPVICRRNHLLRQFAERDARSKPQMVLLVSLSFLSFSF